MVLPMQLIHEHFCVLVKKNTIPYDSATQGWPKEMFIGGKGYRRNTFENLNKPKKMLSTFSIFAD